MVSFQDLSDGAIVKFVGNAWEIGSVPDAPTRFGRVLELPKSRNIDTKDIFVMIHNFEDGFHDYIHINNILRVLSNEEATLRLLEQ